MQVVANPRRSPPRPRRRRGVVLVESAIVYSITLMLVLGVIVMGLGIFRYHQVAFLAREGSRWAAVHAAKYQSEQNGQPATSQSVKAEILNKAVILDPAALTCTLTPDPLTTSTGDVKVTLSYRWTPEVFFVPITMSSTSQTPVLY